MFSFKSKSKLIKLGFLFFKDLSNFQIQNKKSYNFYS